MAGRSSYQLQVVPQVVPRVVPLKLTLRAGRRPARKACIYISITGCQIKDIVTPLIFGEISQMTIYSVKNAIQSYSNIIRLE